MPQYTPIEPPLFSIITATLNNETTIDRAIRSLNTQTYQNFEHIVIDGVSTDGTLPAIKKASIRRPIIISEQDNGIYSALNKGINIATGKYIAFLHADDEYYDDYTLEAISNVISQTVPDIMYGDLVYVSNKNQQKIIRKWVAGEYSKKQILYGWMPPHPTFIMKNELYQRYGRYNEKYFISADYDAMVRFLQIENVKIKYIRKYLVKMATGGKSNTFQNTFKKWKEDFDVAKTISSQPWITISMKNIRKTFQFLHFRK